MLKKFAKCEILKKKNSYFVIEKMKVENTKLAERQKIVEELKNKKKSLEEKIILKQTQKRLKKG